MKGDKIFPKKEDNLPMKFWIYYILSTISFPEKKNILDIKPTYSELTEIIKCKKKELIYFLYSNRSVIANILYEEDKVINIDYNEKYSNFFNYFYLCLLIKEDISIVNYEYSFDFIKDINNYQNRIDEKFTLKKLIISKLIFDLIDNFKNIENSQIIDYNYDLKTIEEENSNILKNNIDLLKKYDFSEDNIKDVKIEEIYIKIIILVLIENIDADFKDITDIENKFRQLKLKSLNMTEAMYEELKYLLESRDDLSKFKIENKEDLCIDSKINFYYILFKYLIKNNIFIYQINLLIETRKNIINIIKKNSNEFSILNIDKNMRSKMEFVFERIVDSKYYYNKYIIIKLNTVLKYYNKYFYESKKDDIKKIKKTTKNIINIDKNDYQQYLDSYEDVLTKEKEMLLRIKSIFFRDEEEVKIEEINKKWEILEKNIKNEKYENISKEYKKNIKVFINNPSHKDIFIKMFNKKTYEWFNNYNSKVESSIISQNTYKYLSDKNQIGKSVEASQSEEKEKENESTKKENNDEQNQKYLLFNKDKNNTNKNIEKSKFEEEIKEWNKIVYWEENIIFFYDKNGLIKKTKIESNIVNVEESKKEILLYKENKIEQKTFNLDSNSNDQVRNEERIVDIKFGFKINDDDYILVERDCVYLYQKLFEKMGETKTELKKGVFNMGIKINEKRFALISNLFMLGGEDKIVIYDLNVKDIIKTVKGYSFNISNKALYLASINKDKNQILLCACKKYTKGQKSGILTIDINSINFKEKKISFFHRIQNFEVCCFCQLFLSEKNRMIFSENKTKEKLKFVLVGGFYSKKRRGCIKLFKIYKGKKTKVFKIKELDDIETGQNLKAPISSIHQINYKQIIIIDGDKNAFSFIINFEVLEMYNSTKKTKKELYKQLFVK